MRFLLPNRWTVAAVAVAMLVCNTQNTYANIDDDPLLVVEKYKSEKGNFSIDFPGTPTVSEDIVPTDVGNITMYSYMYEKSVTEAYMVALSDYPSEMVAMSDEGDLLDGGKNGALESLGISKLDEEKDIELKGGHPGKYFKGTNGTYYVVYKMYLVKNRLYQVAVLKDGSYPMGKEFDAFMSSFKLLDKVKSGSKDSDDQGYTPRGIPDENTALLFDNKFEGAEDKFEIAFPGQPDQSTDKVTTASGDINMVSVIYEQSDSELYSLTYADYPKSSVEITDVEANLERGKQKAISSFGIDHLEEEKNMELAGNKSLYFKGNGESLFMYCKVIMVGNRLYQMNVVREGAYPLEENVNNFMDSFQLRG